MARHQVKLGLMNVFEWHGPGYYYATREQAVGRLVAILLDRLYLIAVDTDNLVEVRYGETGELYGITKHSRPIDLRDIAARLIEAEERDRGEPE